MEGALSPVSLWVKLTTGKFARKRRRKAFIYIHTDKYSPKNYVVTMPIRGANDVYFTCEKNDTSNQKSQRSVSLAPKFPPFIGACSLQRPQIPVASPIHKLWIIPDNMNKMILCWVAFELNKKAEFKSSCCKTKKQTKKTMERRKGEREEKRPNFSDFCWKRIF